MNITASVVMQETDGNLKGRVVIQTPDRNLNSYLSFSTITHFSDSGAKRLFLQIQDTVGVVVDAFIDGSEILSPRQELVTCILLMLVKDGISTCEPQHGQYSFTKPIVITDEAAAEMLGTVCGQYIN